MPGQITSRMSRKIIEEAANLLAENYASPEVAEQMADRIRLKLGSLFLVSTSGPGGTG